MVNEEGSPSIGSPPLPLSSILRIRHIAMSKRPLMLSRDYLPLRIPGYPVVLVCQFGLIVFFGGGKS